MMTRTVLIFLFITGRLLTRKYLIEVANKRGVEGVEGEDKGGNEGADGEEREARTSELIIKDVHIIGPMKPPPIKPFKGKGKIGI